MLYISLSDNSVELIHTKKNIIGAEKIISCSRRELSGGIIVLGMIAEAVQLSNVIKEMLDQQKIGVNKNTKAAIAVSDQEVVIKRINITDSNHNSFSRTIEEIKKRNIFDLDKINGFFKKILINKDGYDVLCIGIPHFVVSHYSNFFENIGLSIKYFTSSSLAIYKLIFPLLEDHEKVLYCEINKTNANYMVLDKLGPIYNFEKKQSVKAFALECKNFIKSLTQVNKIDISKILLSGEGVLEITQEEIAKIPVSNAVILSDFFDQLLTKQKISIDTGGIIKIIFSSCLGLILLAKDNNTPNFIDNFLDSKTKVSPEKPSEKQEIVVSEKNNDQHPDDVNIQNVFPVPDNKLSKTQILEYENNGIIQWLKKRKVILLISVVILLLGGIIVFGSQKKSGLIPFISSPTSTPIPTIVPSITPTPTIDPKLKRSEVTISVYNGTDISGYAKEIAEFLEKKGYRNIAKGNADKDTYEISLIKIKETKKAYEWLMKEDLQEKVTISTVEVLGEDSPQDLILILGKK